MSTDKMLNRQNIDRQMSKNVQKIDTPHFLKPDPLSF